MEGTTIQMAAGDGLLDAVRAFVATGNVGPNTKDDFGYTAMHAAVSYGQADVLRYLLTAGGDVNVKDEDGASSGGGAASIGRGVAAVSRFGALLGHQARDRAIGPRGEAPRSLQLG